MSPGSITAYSFSSYSAWVSSLQYGLLLLFIEQIQWLDLSTITHSLQCLRSFHKYNRTIQFGRLLTLSQTMSLRKLAQCTSPLPSKCLRPFRWTKRRLRNQLVLDQRHPLQRLSVRQNRSLSFNSRVWRPQTPLAQACQ